MERATSVKKITLFERSELGIFRKGANGKKVPIAIGFEAVMSAFYDTEFSSVLYGTLVLCDFVFCE